VFVYRDTSDQPGSPAATVPGPSENDAAYWYDLPGPGAGTDVPAHVVEETRGPFEPLVSSADPPGPAPDAARPDQAPDARPDQAPDARPDQAPVAAGPDDSLQETVHERARKLEQIKDLYLTAEAIGEANVDKHFDQLLAQQRQLISDYFRQPGMAEPEAADGPSAGTASPPTGATSPSAGRGSPAASPTAAAAGLADQAETEPGAPPDPGPRAPGPRPPGPGPVGSAGASEGARVAADQPRVW
jgi:hypothetical protein